MRNEELEMRNVFSEQIERDFSVRQVTAHSPQASDCQSDGLGLRVRRARTGGSHGRIVTTKIRKPVHTNKLMRQFWHHPLLFVAYPAGCRNKRPCFSVVFLFRGEKPLITLAIVIIMILFHRR